MRLQFFLLRKELLVDKCRSLRWVCD